MKRMLLAVWLCAWAAGAHAGPPAGALDPSFGERSNGIDGITIRGFDGSNDADDTSDALIADAQGRLYSIGFAQRDDALPCLAIARFSADGVHDNTFGDHGRVCHPNFLGDNISPSGGSSATFQTDGKILVSGYGFTLPFSPKTYVCRLTQDGAMDASFGDNSTPGCRLIAELDNQAVFDEIRPTVLADAQAI